LKELASFKGWELMKLLEVGEGVTEGWPVSARIPVVDSETGSVMAEGIAFIELGREPEDHDAFADLPFSSQLSSLILEGDNALSLEALKQVALFRGTIARQHGELCLVQSVGDDHKALVKVGIAHGVGGTIEYTFDKGVDIIAEGVLGNGPEERFPIYVLVMPNGTSFHVRRTGDLAGLPPEMTFSWSGGRMTQQND